LRVAKGLSLERTRGYGAAEIKENYERARELCQRLGETVDTVPVLLGLYVFHLVRADLSVARDLAEQCLKLSNDSRHLDYLIESQAVVGYVLCYLGHLEKARHVLEEAVRQYELNWGLKYTITAQDPGVASLALLSVILWLLGFPEESLARLKQAFDLADRLGQPINHAVALAHAAQLRHLRREPEQAVIHAEKGIAIAQQIGNLTWQTACSMHLGIAKALVGDADAGIAEAKKNLELWRAGGAEVNRSYFLAGIAQGEMAAGRPEQALVLLTEALDHAAGSGEAYFVPLIHQIRAECLSSLPGHAADVEESLRLALDTARRQGSKMLELRALHSLCRLGLGSTGPHRQELAALLKTIEPNVDTLDVREARALCA
jgi:tetratricopeptide (TPR) repeat protein